MTSNYEIRPLRELVEFVGKGIPPKYASEKTEDTIAVLNQKTNRNFKIDYKLARLNDLSKKKVPSEKKLINNDVIINSTGAGTAGRIAQLFSVPEPTTVDGHMIIVRAASDKINPIYLGYALKAQQKVIESLQEGSTGQTELNRQRLLDEIEVTFPSNRDKQDEIASLFLSFDNQIAENEKINHHLAEMAQLNLLHLLAAKDNRYRIGDLDLTVSDHVANGSFKSLRENVNIVDHPDYALFLRNVDLKSDLNSERRYVDRHTYDFLKKSHLTGHEVIISNVADVGSVHRVPKLNKPMVVGNNVIFLKSENALLTDYLYVYFQSRLGQHDISTITSGSAQQKFNKTDFRNLRIPVIDSQQIQTMISPFLHYIDNSKLEISNLIQMRDILLPQLMSGALTTNKSAK